MKSFRFFSILVAVALLASALAVPAPAQGVAQQTAPEAAALAPAATSVAMNPFSTGPSYDSGWRAIAQGQILTMWHSLGLNPTMMLVQLEEREYDSSYGIHQLFAGGNDLGNLSAGFGHEEHRVGAYWHNLTTSYVQVTRQEEDTVVDAVRLRIWGVSTSTVDFSSGWTNIPAGQSPYFTHDLGGSVDDYVVDLMFNDTVIGGLGVNQRAYGGRTLGTLNMPFDNGSRVGAYWFGLQTNVIYVHRMPDDEYADQVLVRIWTRTKPDFDSGWRHILPGDDILSFHNTGSSADDYRVDMEFKSDTPPLLINQCFYGGNDIGPKVDNLGPNLTAADNDRVGAFWYGLDTQYIKVFRFGKDKCADHVRIRIWNFWTPTQPNYDTGWKPVSQDQEILLDVGAPPSADNRLIDLQFKDSGMNSIGINQRGLGGMDWTDSTRQGGRWRLMGNNLALYRRPEDTNATYMRARIWNMPDPAYDSGWQPFTTAYTLQLQHGLGGNPAEYLVDVQFQNSKGTIHQFGYGGFDALYTDANQGHQTGGFWNWLDDQHIEIRRLPEDSDILTTRTRIWMLSHPDYDSGMINPDIGTTLTHNLNVKPENLFVNLVFNNTSGPKLLNQMYYGGSVLGSNAVAPHIAGDRVGGFWRSLTSTSVVVVRQNEDTWIDEARLRLWVVKQNVYIPVVKK